MVCAASAGHRHGDSLKIAIFELMRWTTLCAFYFILAFPALAQEVDLMRLSYNKATLQSAQLGMAVSPDGRWIVFVYEDKSVKIFDATVGKFVKRFKAPFDGFFDVQATNNKTLALIGPKTVHLIDMNTAQLLKEVTVDYEVTKTAFSGKHNLLALGQKQGFVDVINLVTGEKIFSTQYKKHHVSALAIHPEGNAVAVGVMSLLRSQSPIKVFDLHTGEEKGESQPGIYTMAAYNESGDELVVAGLNATATMTKAVLLDAATLKVKSKFDAFIILNGVMSYGGIYQNKKLLTLTASRAFSVLDGSTGKLDFTTKSDKFKMPPFPVMGIGAFHVYPLNGQAGKFLLNASGNNINQVYDLNSNSIVGYFFSDSNDDFAVVSKDGRVDGTPDALAKVFWTTRGTFQRTSLESILEKGFTPRLLSHIVNEESSVLASFDVEKTVSTIPVLAIQSVNGEAYAEGSIVPTPQKKSSVKIAVTSNAQEVTELRLYQNGKLMKSVPGTGAKEYTFELSLSSSFGEENFFFINAGSRSGIDSEKAKFTIAYKGATQEKPTLYLVTIGIDKYKNQKYNLNYAQADADGVARSMGQYASQLFKAVVPYSIRNEKAVKANILNALEDIKKKSHEQDLLILYYAGHGVMSGESASDQEFFMVPSDVTQLYGRADLLKEKAISASLLKEYAQSINAQKQVFILDACQSAGALESVTERGVAEEKAIAQLARSTGTFWITSTGSNQYASEFDKLGHGIFTYTLIEGIDGKADANQDKKLTVRELSTYIENKVPELSEQLKGTAQYPSAYSFGNDFPILVYK